MGLAGVAGAAGGIGMGLQAAGGLFGGQAQQSAADYQAQVAKYNAQIESQNAAQAIGAGESQAEISEMRTGQQVGQAKAAQASRGVQTGVGSALDVRQGIASAGRVNALTIKNNAARAAYGYQVQGASDTAQAGADIAEGENAMTASLIGTAANVTSDAWKMSQAGLFPSFGTASSSGTSLGISNFGDY